MGREGRRRWNLGAAARSQFAAMKTLDAPRAASALASVSASPAGWATRRALWLSLGALALLCAPLFLFRLGGWAFFDADEGRYAQIPLAMLKRGDFVTPFLNGVKFFDKPPLLYWLIALAYRVFGVSEGAARLVPAVAALGAIAGTYGLGRRMFGARAGWLGALALATSFGWPIMARVVITDMLVSSLTFVALAFWWLGRSERVNRRAAALYFAAFWAALALGVLAKGPIAVVLAGGTIALFLLLSGEREPFRRMGWPAGLTLFFLIAAPWFVEVQRRNPEFFQDFWIDQNLGRFLGTLAEQDHDNGPLYFFIWLPILLLPWTPFALLGLWSGWRKVWPRRGKTRTEKERAALFLFCGALFITLFFSSSRCKLVTYILPVVPLLATALGGYFDWFWTRYGGRSNRAMSVSAFVLAALLGVAGVAAMVAGPRALVKMDVSGSLATGAGALLVIWGAALALSAMRFGLRGTLTATALGFCAVLTFATGIISAIAPALTTRHLVEAMRPGLDANGEIVSFGFAQSLSFYSQSRVAMVGEPDEMRAGIAHLPLAQRRRWFLTPQSVLPFARKATPVYFVARNSLVPTALAKPIIAAWGDEVRVVARNKRFLVWGNRAAWKWTPPLPEH